MTDGRKRPKPSRTHVARTKREDGYPHGIQTDNRRLNLQPSPPHPGPPGRRSRTGTAAGRCGAVEDAAHGNRFAPLRPVTTRGALGTPRPGLIASPRGSVRLPRRLKLRSRADDTCAYDK